MKSVREMYDSAIELNPDPRGAMRDVADERTRHFETQTPFIVDTAEIGILRGRSDVQVLADVRKQHPEAKTARNQISQYRSTLRKAGVPVPTNVEVRHRQEAELLAG